MVEMKEGRKFYNIDSTDLKHVISWSKDIELDLQELSFSCFESTGDISDSILEDDRLDNMKLDMWFLPAVYLFRQSIELLMKSIIAKYEKKNQGYNRFLLNQNMICLNCFTISMNIWKLQI